MKLPNPITETLVERRETLGEIANYVNRLALMNETDPDLFPALSTAGYALFRAEVILRIPR